jgi:hypothetical protein
VGAVEQTPIALTLSDRSLPLIAAKCGPTVARRASHVRFLSNSSQLFRPVCIGGRRSTSGREQIGTPNLVLVQALGLRLANAPTRIPRLGNWSRRVASPLLRHRSSPLANSRSVQPRNWVLASEKRRLSEVRHMAGEAGWQLVAGSHLSWPVLILLAIAAASQRWLRLKLQRQSPRR